MIVGVMIASVRIAALVWRLTDGSHPCRDKPASGKYNSLNPVGKTCSRRRRAVLFTELSCHACHRPPAHRIQPAPVGDAARLHRWSIREEMLVKYAAKKTWPEKSAVWEHEGNADTAQAFAVEFAAIEQLAVDVEFLVMEREGNGEIQFFRVAGLSPSQVVPTEARATGTSNPMHVDQTAAPAADETPEPLGMPSLRPAINMLIYMAKVSLGAILVVGVLGYLMVKVIAPAFG